MNEESVQVKTTAYSDIGTQRKANEDSYYVAENENLLIVCDGMGGHVAGGLASKIAVETIKDVYFNLEEDQLQKLFPDIDQNLTLAARLLIAAVRIANRRLFNMAAKFPKLRGMGTTVVAISFDSDAATLVHVGDSRVFRISDDAITQLTEDHSWLNELIEDNEINEEQIETFSQKNVITRALGTAPSLRIDLHCEKYKKDDLYLLCTDGLHNAVDEESIKKAFKNQKSSIESTVKKLIEKAKSIDGSDNITAAAAKVDEDCDASSQIGISTTVAAEDPKNSAKIDRFIQEKFGDSRLGFLARARSHGKFPPYLTLGIAILCSAIFFVLGISQSSKSLSGNHQPTPAHASLSEVSEVMPPSQQQEDIASSKEAARNGQHPKAIVIPGKSALGKNAVMAIVFFNSSEDYDRSGLEKRAKVLDKFHPYGQNSKEWSQNNFTIFLIDSANNVIRKTSGVEIPKSPGM
jgi:protein phosphatase